MSEAKTHLHAVVGVARRDTRTFYVRRSAKMANFPNVWSLTSQRFDPAWLTDPQDLEKVNQLVRAMSRERFRGTPMVATRHLISGEDPDSPVGEHVHLHLYEIAFGGEPRLNPDFYSENRWMTPAQYQEASAGLPCGLCLRLWSDYAWLAGLADRPFVPTP